MAEIFTYHTIQFVDSKNWGVISSNWVSYKNAKSYTWWPTYPTDRAIDKALERHETNSPDWGFYEITFKGQAYSSVIQARQKLKRIIDGDDSTTDMEPTRLRKRKRTGIVKPCELDDSDEDPSSFSPAIPLPPVPQRRKSPRIKQKTCQSWQNCNDSGTSRQLLSAFEDTVRPSPIIHNMSFHTESKHTPSASHTPRNPVEQEDSHSWRDASTPIISPLYYQLRSPDHPMSASGHQSSLHPPHYFEPEPQRQQLNNWQQQLPPENEECNGSSACTEFHKKTMVQIVWIKETLKKLTETSNLILSHLKDNNHHPAQTLAADPNHQQVGINAMENMPLQTQLDLENLETRLQDEDFKKILVTQMSIIGGSNLKDIIRRLLKRIMSDDLASKYSWIGFKKKEKFSSLTLKNCFFAAVRNNKMATGALDSEIESFVKEWLKHGNTRKNKHTP